MKKAVRKWISGVGHSLLDVVLPTKCASCGGLVEGSDYPHVCRPCSGRVHLIEGSRCSTCGYPVFGENESVAHCQHCEGLNPKFAEGRSIGLFSGPVRSLVYALKYEHGLWALRDIRVMAKRSEGLFRYLYDSVLLPVPLHPRKKRERGYNQSALIAEELGDEFGLEVDYSLLKRVLDTTSQTQFNRSERRRNLRNAFSIASKSAIGSDLRYILIDDVFTTGSTLNACAAVLRKAGVGQVDALTVGHG